MNKEIIRKDKSSLSLWNPDYVLEKNTLDFIKRNILKSYDVILDYGCGNSPYENLFTYNKYIKADISQNSKQTVELLLNNNSFEKLPLENNSIDLIICMDVLEHSGNFDKILKDFYRVLKPNGQLFISLPFLYREHEMPNDLYRYTSSFIEKESVDLGFKICEIKKMGGGVLCYLFSLDGINN